MAASVCNQGGVIAYPTESVFGLGCNPDDLTAVEKLLALKNRPVEKGLILIAAHIEQLQPYIIASNTAMQRISSQTQPTTWLVKTSSYTPAWITGQHNKVAVRITQHPVARHLCAQLNYPLVSTSANPGGKPPARSGLQARIYFAHTVDYYVAGKVGALKNPTQIIDMETGKIIRTG
jgi:L-threonylcarbamoyladenylate synthase